MTAPKTQPVAVTGPETLDADMTPGQIADTLARIRFRNGAQLLALADREVRDFLVDAVRARIRDRNFLPRAVSEIRSR
jgi:hypothetical protein